MIRKEPERGGGGRRPLLAAFIGNNRQMLNDIRDSLSHLRKTQLEAAEGEGMQVRPELSQSTPNLADKSAPPASGTKKGLENHHKTLAEIREALRPFQTQLPGEGDVTQSKINEVMSLGVDEDIARRALKLYSNPDDAIQLLLYIIQSCTNNGISKVPPAGLFGYPVNRRPSFESKYGPSSPSASDTTSVRSDSPSLSGVLLSQRQPLVNGHQTPPPLPPRAPIAPHGHAHSSARGQTPPPMAVGENGAGAANGYGPSTSAEIPAGHVQQLIKRMSPAQNAAQLRSQVFPKHPHPHSHPHSAATIPPQQAVLGKAVPSSRVSGVLGHPLGQHSGGPSPSPSPSPSSTSSASSAPGRVTINLAPHPLPPPYSQAQARSSGVVPPALVSLPAEQSHLLGAQLPDYLMRSSPDSPLNLSTASSSAFSDNSSGLVGGKVGPGPVTASRRPMAPHAPIIMQSVRSKEVTKPLPQTATVPLSPPGPPHPLPPHSYVSQVQVSVPGGLGPPPPPATATTTAHTPNLQIQITGRAPHHVVYSHPHNVPQYATEPRAPPPRGRPTIQINFPSGGGHAGGHAYPNLAGVGGGGSYSLYQQRPASDTGSTPRSDSPVSRTTNQSPLSILSTTSSPSTNSDVPDKPPPPYPFAPHRQPPLPPRAPITNKPLPPPPPPARSTVTVHVHASPGKMSGGQTVAVSSFPAPVSSHNGQGAETASEQGDDTDTETVSSSEAGATAAAPERNSATGEKHRCMSPMPQRKPEARERDKLRRDTKVRMYSPQAFKFYMEQHVENVLKIHQQRLRRRTQLETEMAKVKLSEEAAHQMRRMLHQKESNYIRLKRAKMDKSMFTRITTLGVGAFGEVGLVRKRDTHMLYAMKTLRKADVLKRNQVAHVKAERDILAEADNEWVVKLYYSFQDAQFLYFVMDYVPGGDLMGLLIRMEVLEEPLAQFYVAELVLAIQSVHRMGFIHRDIKPDNILIDRNGHIKLTDFGLCTGFRWTHNSKYYQRDGAHARQDSMEVKCQLDEQCQCEILKPLERRRKREQRCLAHSLVGTPNYIAPEVLLRSSGYTKVCDWWSVGVILFEMLVGHPPFYASTPAETQYKVINWKETLRIPFESNLSPAAKDLIVRLCCGPEERLGRERAGDIQAHPFFHDLCFHTLRKQRPPYVPNIRHATDTSNFDPVDPDKLHSSQCEDSKRGERLENGKHPEHAFFEFTFRRFFDDGGHPMAAHLEDPDSNSPVYV